MIFGFFCELFWDYFIEGGVFIHQKAYNVFMSCSVTHFLTKIRLCVYCFLTHFSCWTIYFVHLSIPIYSSFFCSFFYSFFLPLLYILPVTIKGDIYFPNIPRFDVFLLLMTFFFAILWTQMSKAGLYRLLPSINPRFPADSSLVYLYG